MTAIANLWVLAVALAGMAFVAWVAYNVGQNAARREYQAALANARARERRARQDLERHTAHGRMLRGVPNE